MTPYHYVMCPKPKTKGISKSRKLSAARNKNTGSFAYCEVYLPTKNKEAQRVLKEYVDWLIVGCGGDTRWST